MHSPHSLVGLSSSHAYTPQQLKNTLLPIQVNELSVLMDWLPPFSLSKQIKPCAVCACDIKHLYVCCGYTDKCECFSFSVCFFLSLAHTPGAAEYLVSAVSPVCSGRVRIELGGCILTDCSARGFDSICAVGCSCKVWSWYFPLELVMLEKSWRKKFYPPYQ